MLRQIKAGREYPQFGYEQSKTIIRMNEINTFARPKDRGGAFSGQSKHIIKKTKTMEQLNAFIISAQQAMFNDQFSRTTSRIRFDHPELYLQLRKLASKMSFYQFKMTVIYWSCYLDDFEEQCNDYLDNEHR